MNISQTHNQANAQAGFLKVKGGNVWYEIVGNNHKNAIPLLTLHGGPGYPSDYIRTIEGLADERPVIFCDQLGCGKSDRTTDPKLWTIEAFVEELTIIRRELGLSRVHILGHSWGTMLAIDYLLTKPSGIKSLILASPCLNIPRWLQDAEKYRYTLSPEIQEIFHKHEEVGTTDSAEYQKAVQVYSDNFVCRIKPYPDALKKADAKCGKNIYNHMWGPTESFMKGGTLINYDRSGSLKEITVPTLFTCGRYDEASPETVQYFQSRLPGSQLKIFENSAHVAHLEETDAFLETIRSFIKQAEND